MSYESYFYFNNGFEINKNFEETKKNIISNIGLTDISYYFEIFEYQNLFYVIPFNETIFNKSNLLANIYADKLPYFETNITTACSKTIKEDFFNIRFFIKTIITIFNYISKMKHILMNY